MATRIELQERAQLIFREVLEDSELVLFDKMVAADVPAWDSLNHITLVMSLEEEFGVSFSTREVMGWQNVGQMLDSLVTKHE